MAAAIARKPREPLVIEEVIVAAPKPREVRIKIICTSLCHSDINYWKLEVDSCLRSKLVFLLKLINDCCFLLKRPPAIFPRILGHEAIG